MSKETAILFGPFVGELYWECGRFAPILSYMAMHSPSKDKVKYIVLTREERFDLYGMHADILLPLNIPGDYTARMQPNCFGLDGLDKDLYKDIVKLFKKRYEKKYNIIRHIYPLLQKKAFANKHQFSRDKLEYVFSPRQENFSLVNDYITDKRPLVVLAPRFRKGYKRNWKGWQLFYNLLYNDDDLMEKFQFIICGKESETISDSKNRFLDMTKIPLNKNSSLIGLFLAIMERTILTVGSQSALPNISLLYKKEVLTFGHQKHLHTKTYNPFNTPITFLDNAQYDISPVKFFNHMKEILKRMDETGK